VQHGYAVRARDAVNKFSAVDKASRHGEYVEHGVTVAGSEYAMASVKPLSFVKSNKELAPTSPIHIVGNKRHESPPSELNPPVRLPRNATVYSTNARLPAFTVRDNSRSLAFATVSFTAA
jgi:hypothetical protein